MSPPRAIALFTGGLDSMLAARIVHECGVEVQLMHYSTPFTTLTAMAEQAAAELNLPLTIVQADNDYLQLLTEPRFGRCESVAPCLDCREHLFRLAGRALDQHHAQFIVTGEVLGQRRWGQRRRDFEALPQRAGLGNVVERPLSAKLLPATLAQQQGWVDREQMHDIQGKGRRRQLALAERYSLERIPAPLTRCCLLAERKVGQRLLTHLQAGHALTQLDCELMTLGEHKTLSTTMRLVLSRNASEGDTLRAIASRHENEAVALLASTSFRGPLALLSGTIQQQDIDTAAALIKQRSQEPIAGEAEFLLYSASGEERLLL